MIEVEKIMRAGAALLEPKLNPLGFTFRITNVWPMTSGGPAANACFVRDNRAIHFSFRFSLGLVSYQTGAIQLTHEQYMRALGVLTVARYPGVSADPMAAFADLASDLQYCDSFLLDSGTAFSILAGEYNEPPSGFQRLDHV
jgi:hypothetical protein